MFRWIVQSDHYISISICHLFSLTSTSVIICVFWSYNLLFPWPNMPLAYYASCDVWKVKMLTGPKCLVTSLKPLNDEIKRWNINFVPLIQISTCYQQMTIYGIFSMLFKLFNYEYCSDSSSIIIIITVWRFDTRTAMICCYAVRDVEDREKNETSP